MALFERELQEHVVVAYESEVGSMKGGVEKGIGLRRDLRGSGRPLHGELCQGIEVFWKDRCHRQSWR